MNSMINGLSTVNCGIIKTFNVNDPLCNKAMITAEILLPELHNPKAQIVCYYYWDKNLQAKVEVTVHRSLVDFNIGSSIYYFKDKLELQHYRSCIYKNYHDVPKKYEEIVKQLIKVLWSEFGR